MDPRIRAARAEDVPEFLRIYSPFVLNSAVSFETEVPTAAEFARRIAGAHEWLVIDVDGLAAGYAYAAPFHHRAAYRWSVEVSIYLDAAARGRGWGRVLLARLLERLKERRFVNAFAGTTLPNEASVTLFESLGFQRIALQEQVGFKLGSWHDVGWWQKQLRERSVPPTEPTGPPRSLSVFSVTPPP